MRSAAIIVLLASSTSASAQTIFPAGGEVPPVPVIWISAAEVPAISVRSAGAPVAFDIDEMDLERGPHRIAIHPQLDIGTTFTVIANKTRATFTVVDGARDGIAADQPDVTVEYERVSLVRRHGADILAIDAAVRRGTVMWLLVHDQPDIMDTERRVWIGEGSASARAVTYDPTAPLEPTRFEIPLAEFDSSCASKGVVDFSPYTEAIDGTTTLYPIATFEIDHGKIRLPLSIIGEFDQPIEQQHWLPCPGATLDAAPPAPEPVVEPTAPPGASATDKTPSNARAANAQIAATCEVPSSQSPSPSHSGTKLLQMLAVLFGTLVLMWRSTSRMGA